MTTLEGPPLAEAGGIGALTLGGFLEEVTSRYDGEALVFDDPLAGGTTVRWSYARLAQEAHRVGRALMAAGVGRGARVGILMGNRPEAVASVFGAGLVGAVAVPLSTFSAPAELEFMLGHADVQMVLAQREMRGHDYLGDLLALDPELDRAEPPLRSAAFPFLESVAVVGAAHSSGSVRSWTDFMDSADRLSDHMLLARAGHIHPSDPAVIIYSSGTTERPKGMLHCHRAVTLQFWLQAGVFGRHPGTRLWTALPMFWTAGLNTAMGPTLAGGGCWVMQESFDPGDAIALMEREKVTEPYTLPHQTAALEEHPSWKTADLSALRCVFGKSAFARHPTVDGDPNWNSPVAYGLSETASIFAGHGWDTPRAVMRESTGRLLPGNRLRVVDPDTGARLGPGQDGELAVAGPTLMEHYVGRTRYECFDPDGFFHTGDAGFFDTEGYVHWTGRRTEMIKTAGANVSPAELEVALRAFGPLKLARVIGLPDPRLGQRVVLAAVVKEGEATSAEEIKAFLRERVSAYKVPKSVVFFSDGEVPMTGSDTKVRDADLLKLVGDRLSREESQ
ncbi:MAG: class I adenylate-forming enzyme family protein [Acidimicrobiales bacterium]